MGTNDKQITGIIYKTTNLINGKWYIGKDELNNPKYIGSGMLLTKAVQKYGKENFKKEILAEAGTRAALSQLEELFIKNTNAIKDPLSYNIAAGGNGGNTIAGYTDDERKEFGSKISTRWANKSDEQREEFSRKLSEKATGRVRTPEHQTKLNESCKKSWTEERRNKKSAEVIAFYKTEEGERVKNILREKCPQYGEDNGFFNKKHTQESIDKMIRKKKGSKCPARRLFSDDEQAQIKALYDSGTRTGIIAKMFSTSGPTVLRYVREIVLIKT